MVIKNNEYSSTLKANVTNVTSHRQIVKTTPTLPKKKNARKFITDPHFTCEYYTMRNKKWK